MIAEHTVNAELDESPAAAGTMESIKIFMPPGATPSLTGELSAKIALYPHKK